jgi:hypothetical protein
LAEGGDTMMPSIRRFLDLLEAVSRRDRESIAAIVRETAEDERKRKHVKAARMLLEALDVANSDAGYDMVARNSCEATR